MLPAGPSAIVPGEGGGVSTLMRSHGLWNWVLLHSIVQLPSNLPSVGFFREWKHLVAIKVPGDPRNLGMLSYLGSGTHMGSQGAQRFVVNVRNAAKNKLE